MLLEMCTYISRYIYICVCIYICLYVYTAYVYVRVCIYTHFCFVFQSKSENLSASAAIKVKRFLRGDQNQYLLSFVFFFFTTYVYVNKPTSRSQRRKRFESTRPSKRWLTPAMATGWDCLHCHPKTLRLPQHSVLISQPMLKQDPRLKTMSCEESEFLFRREENASAVCSCRRHLAHQYGTKSSLRVSRPTWADCDGRLKSWLTALKQKTTCFPQRF